MLEKIKQGLAEIATVAGTRKRTAIIKLDKAVFADIETAAKTLIQSIANHEKQIRREQRAHEQESEHTINSERTVQTTASKQTTARGKTPKRKANTTKRA